VWRAWRGAGRCATSSQARLALPPTFSSWPPRLADGRVRGRGATRRQSTERARHRCDPRPHEGLDVARSREPGDPRARGRRRERRPRAPRLAAPRSPPHRRRQGRRGDRASPAPPARRGRCARGRGAADEQRSGRGAAGGDQPRRRHHQPGEQAHSLAFAGDNFLRFVPDDVREGAAVVALRRRDRIDAIVPVWRRDAGNAGLARSVRSHCVAWPPDLWPHSDAARGMRGPSRARMWKVSGDALA
jgi:hypothetical protein